MKSFICRRREQVSYSPAEDAADDTDHNGPEEGHVHVQHRLRDDAGNQADQDVPNEMKHKRLQRIRNCERVYVYLIKAIKDRRKIRFYELASDTPKASASRRPPYKVSSWKSP